MNAQQHYLASYQASPKSISIECFSTLSTTGCTLSMSDIIPYFNEPIHVAARTLKVSVVKLRSFCRDCGLLRWPYKNRDPVAQRDRCFDFAVSSPTGFKLHSHQHQHRSQHAKSVTITKVVSTLPNRKNSLLAENPVAKVSKSKKNLVFQKACNAAVALAQQCNDSQHCLPSQNQQRFQPISSGPMCSNKIVLSTPSSPMSQGMLCPICPCSPTAQQYNHLQYHETPRLPSIKELFGAHLM